MGDRDHVLTSRYPRDDHAYDDDDNCGIGSCVINERMLRRVEPDEDLGRPGSEPPYLTVYRFADNKLIPDIVHGPNDSTFETTLWEWRYSRILPMSGFMYDPYGRTMSAYTPVIDGYRVVGHLGLDFGDQLFIPVNTVGLHSPYKNNYSYYGTGFDHKPTARKINRYTKDELDDHRWAEIDDHLSRINSFLDSGGLAFVKENGKLGGSEQFLPRGWMCYVLVAPDGQLLRVLKAKWNPPHSLKSDLISGISGLIDLALFVLDVWAVIDLGVLAIDLFRVGALAARGARIRALDLLLKNRVVAEKIVLKEAGWAARGQRLESRAAELARQHQKRTVAVGELWEEGKAPRSYQGISGAKQAEGPPTRLTQPPRHIRDPRAEYPEHVRKMNNEDFFKWRNSSEGQEWIERHGMNPEATPRKDMRKRLQDKKEEGRLKEDHAHHAGRRDHDAEAHSSTNCSRAPIRRLSASFTSSPVCQLALRAGI